MITLECSELRVAVEPERGAEIRFVGRPEGPNALAYEDWRSPLRASRSLSYGSSRLDFLSEYRGGWQELFPNAAAECTVGGVPLPYHGEVSSAQWEIVRASATGVDLRVAARLPLVLERRMRLAGEPPSLLIEERVVNESALPVDFIWGHHPAFVARPGAKIDLPPGEVRVDDGFDSALADLQPGGSGSWPYAPDKSGGVVDLAVVPAGPVERLCYRPDLPEGWAAFRDPASGTGVAMAWDIAVFPHVWFWQEIGGQGFPWYGRARIAAIEPVCAWPIDGLAHAIERGQARRLQGGEEATAWLTMTLFAASERPVVGVHRDGRVDEGH